MESIILEKQRRSDNKNEKPVDPAITDVSETSGTCLIISDVVISFMYACYLVLLPITDSSACMNLMRVRNKCLGK